ncbi:MAG: TraB/GumN family protein [Pseudomonas sp.]|nr:TraB/GumN family protein [Pseudomonas sp.]
MRTLTKLALALCTATAATSLALAATNQKAPAATAPAAAAEAHRAAPVPLLWKVSDADNAVYLLGSFHLLKNDDYPVSADIDAAFDDAEKVVFEIAPEAMLDPANGQAFLAAAGYGDARTLRTVLPAELHEKLNRLMGGQVASVDAYEPWFVNLSLTLGVSQALGFSAEKGLDRHLMTRAAEANKPTGGLETMSVQLGVLDGTPMDEQVAGLKEILDKPQELPTKLGELHAAWRAGDVDTLDRVTRAEMAEKSPVTYRRVNVDRNDAWVPQIRRMLDESASDDTLVVVGALHLLGNDGVVEKLRAQGLSVERVCTACAAAGAEPKAAGK